MKLNIFIADDDPKITQTLECIIRDWEDQYRHEINLQTKNDLKNVEVTSLIPYDLIILDIEIGSVNGIEFAKALRQSGSDAAIAFISNYEKYAIEGYSTHAISYLLKPLNPEKVFLLLDETFNRVGDYNSKTIWVSSGGNHRFISTSSILFITIFGKSMEIHLLDKVETYIMPLKLIDPQLPGTSLLRCHKSYIVNIEYVTGLSGNNLFVGPDEELIPIGRVYKENIKRQLLTKRR
ncbi:MAG: response regulator transcription factor [Oscillospiraceae bacterium]|nr:response regulator transcription factor [Oscillospiraceae bacterium]